MSINFELQVVSPCIGVCSLGEDGLCLGCFRSSSEIRLWSVASYDEKLLLLEELKERRRASGRVGCGERTHRRRRTKT